jgi:hypothetical protein
MKFKTVKRFTRVFKSLQFKSEAENLAEYLSLQSTYDENGRLTEELKFREDGTIEERNVFRWVNNMLVSHLIEMPQEGMEEEYRYTRTENGKLLKEQKFYSGEPGEATEYFYNPDGLPEKIIKYDVDGVKEGEELFEYADKQLTVHRIYDAEGKLSVVNEYVNKDGRPVLRKEKDAEGNLMSETEYEYDDKGNLINSVTRNEEGEIVESISVKFDERGNVTEKKIRDYHPRVFCFQYDENNRCISEEMYNAFGQLSSKTVYEYDDAGELIAEINYNIDHSYSHHDYNKAHRYEYGFS